MISDGREAPNEDGCGSRRADGISPVGRFHQARDDAAIKSATDSSLEMNLRTRPRRAVMTSLRTRVHTLPVAARHVTENYSCLAASRAVRKRRVDESAPRPDICPLREHLPPDTCFPGNYHRRYLQLQSYTITA